MIIWLILIISFILDSVFSTFISLNSFLIPLFTLMALIIISSYFKEKTKKYLSICFLTGMAYDLIYTDTILIHAFIFLLLGFLVINLNRLLSNNHISAIFMAIVVVVCYRVVMYLFLLISGILSFDLFHLSASIYNSLIINIIYIFLLSVIVNLTSHKHKTRKGIYT